MKKQVKPSWRTWGRNKKMIEAVEQKLTEDTGLRGSFSGRLFIDRSVFFKRPEVIKYLKAMKTSDAYPK